MISDPSPTVRFSARERALLQQLQLLCEAETGLEAIATRASILARDIIGAASTSIFWLDRSGNPAGFFHDCAPAELKDLFVTHFDELFSRPGEPNMITLIASTGPPIGYFVDPVVMEATARSNVWRYLCEPLGHYHCLDIRIDRQGRGTAVVCLWHPPENPFRARDLAKAQPIHALLCQAAEAAEARGPWQAYGPQTAHLITSADGTRLLAIDSGAERLLTAAHLLRQGIPMAGSVREPPLFCSQLAQMLDRSQPASLHLPCAEGRIALSAARSRRLDADGDDAMQLLVTVTLERPTIVTAVEWLCELPLTFLQRRIALFALKGGQRSQCEQRFAVSQEALKKHLRAVYEATGSSDWTSLRGAFPAGN